MLSQNDAYYTYDKYKQIILKANLLLIFKQATVKMSFKHHFTSFITYTLKPTKTLPHSILPVALSSNFSNSDKHAKQIKENLTDECTNTHMHITELDCYFFSNVIPSLCYLNVHLICCKLNIDEIRLKEVLTYLLVRNTRQMCKNENENHSFIKQFCNICQIFCCPIHLSKNTEAHNSIVKYSLNIKQSSRDPNIISIYNNSICRQCECKQKDISPLTQQEIAWLQILYIPQLNNSCYYNHILGISKCSAIHKALVFNYNDEESSNQATPHKLLARKTIKIKKNTNSLQYVPCSCQFECDQRCPCIKRFGICFHYCLCKSFCTKQYQGCSCELSCIKGVCSCLLKQRECDPLLCKCSLNCTHQMLSNRLECTLIPYCKNINLTLNVKKKLLLGVSTIPNAGYGIFAGTAFKAGEILGEYIGELITHSEVNRRDAINDKKNGTYLFSLNDVWYIDCAEFGNKLRYANHAEETSPQCNAKSDMLVVNCHSRIIYYAVRDIKQYEEIMLDYMIVKKYSWLM